MTKDMAITQYERKCCKDSYGNPIKILYGFTIGWTATRAYKGQHVYYALVDVRDLPIVKDRNDRGEPCFRVRFSSKEANSKRVEFAREFNAELAPIDGFKLFEGLKDDDYDNKGIRWEKYIGDLLKAMGHEVRYSKPGTPFEEGPDMWIDDMPVQVKFEGATLADEKRLL